MNNRLITTSILFLLVSSVLIQSNAFGDVLSASNKNSQGRNLFALNSTANVRYMYVNNVGKLFVANNADFANSTTVFDASKILIRNPAGTFAYTISSGAIVGNRTISLPVTLGADTFATLGLAQTFTGIQTYNADVIIAATKKLFFDGGGDTYNIETSPNVLDTFVGGFIGQRLQGNAQIETITYTIANGTNRVLSDLSNTPNGVVNIISDDGKFAMFNTRGGVNAVNELLDPNTSFSITAGTAASTNVYWSAGNSRYEIENKSGATRTYTVEILRYR